MFRRRYVFPERDMTAIPLTPQEVTQLIASFQEADRAQRKRRPDISHSYREGQTLSFVQRVGAAAAHGHDTVPSWWMNFTIWSTSSGL